MTTVSSPRPRGHRPPSHKIPTQRGELTLNTGCNLGTARDSHAAWETDRSRSRRARGSSYDRGQATIEFMAMVPLVLAVLVAALQVMILTYTAHAASQAARDGARAFSLGGSPVAAAQASLPGAITLVNASPTGFAHGVTVTVKAPMVFVGDGEVTRSVTMP